jgi:phosphatidylglycerol:prolipoprotein diacylglycerol transferase
VLTGYFLMKRYKLPWWKAADAFAPGIAVGNFFGRLGCFSAGCCWGKPTTLPWGVKFTDQGNAITGVPTVVNQLTDPAQQAYWSQKLGGELAPLHLHPTQLYESFSMFIVFFFLLWLHKHKRFNGQVILFYALLYSIIRFLIEFLRDDPRGDVFGLTSSTGLSTSQLISIVVGFGALVLLVIRWRRASVGNPNLGNARAARI